MAVRRSMLISVPVSIILGLISLLVALHYGQGLAGLLWFFASSLVNVARMLLCRFPYGCLIPHDPVEPKNLDPASVKQHLFLQSVMAATSGVVWAFIAVLCDGYTAPQSVFLPGRPVRNYCGRNNRRVCLCAHADLLHCPGSFVGCRMPRLCRRV